MNKALKAFAVTIALLALIVAPACHKKAPPVVAPKIDTSMTVPPVPATVTTATVQPVTDTADFVRPNETIAVDTLPGDIEELNRVAQSRGYVQDAFFEYN